jgi:hypothetical protein
MISATSLAQQRFAQLGGARAAFARAHRGQTLINLDLVGSEMLEQALRDLGSDRQIRATLKRAVVDVLEPVAVEARRRAPRSPGVGRTKSGRTVDPGSYAESIEVSTTLSRRQRRGRSVKYSGPTAAEAFVGPKPNSPGVLEEFGTVSRHWRNGKSTGMSPAQPHMRPAWEMHKDGILVALGRVLWVQIQATATRLARRQANLLRKKA